MRRRGFRGGPVPSERVPLPPRAATPASRIHRQGLIRIKVGGEHALFWSCKADRDRLRQDLLGLGVPASCYRADSNPARHEEPHGAWMIEVQAAFDIADQLEDKWALEYIF